MSKSQQVLTREGLYANVPAGRRVRIDPELLSSSGLAIAPNEINVSNGFEVVSKQGTTFDVQNTTNSPADCSWVATYLHSDQYDHSQATQTGIGAGGSDPSPESPLVFSATDSSAIHTNVANEIGAITEKLAPVDADVIVVEDSEDSGSKKKVQIGNLSSGGVVTAYDIDLSVLDSVDFKALGDNTYSIGGVDFFADNTNNANAFGIVNGQGLVTESDGSARAFSTSSRAAPNLAQRISDSVPEFNPAVHSVGLYARMIGANMNQNNETQIAGFERHLSSPVDARASMERLYEIFTFGSGDRKGWFRTNGNTGGVAINPTDNGADPVEATEDVVFVTLNPRNGVVQYWTGVWDGGWPLPKAMRHRGTLYIDGTPGAPLTPYNNDLGVVLCAAWNLSGAPGYISTFSNVRLDYWLS